MDRQTLRDWVIRFNQQGPEGLINIPSPGAPAKLKAEHKAFLARIVEDNPVPAIHGVVRSRACDLIMQLHEKFGLSVSDDTIYRAALHQPRLLASQRAAAGVQAGPRRNRGVQKNFAARVADIRQTLPPDTPIEVWFQDEMRVGQKNKLTYRWARTGSRPPAVHDQRTQSTYLFGAVCPEQGKGSGLVLPVCNAEAMQLHLDDIAAKVAPRAHAILIFDPCLSGCHPQPLAVVFGHAHGRSPAWQSSVPTIAPRVPATFSRRRGLRRLPGEGSLERRVCLPPLSSGGRAVPLRKSSWRLALPQVPP